MELPDTPEIIFLLEIRLVLAVALQNLVHPLLLGNHCSVLLLFRCLVVVCGRVWSCVVVCGRVWSCVVVCGRVRSLVIVGGRWWSLVVVVVVVVQA